MRPHNVILAALALAIPAFAAAPCACRPNCGVTPFTMPCCPAASTNNPTALDWCFQVKHVGMLTVGESYINVINDGANGASLLGPGSGGVTGNICVNVYAFDPNEEMISCCSCLVTPDQVRNLGVNRDITSNATGPVPNSLTIKLVTTLAGGNGAGATCTNSAASVNTATTVPGLAAFGTNLHATPAPGVYATTETPFTPVSSSTADLASLANRCSNIIGNLSGFGICASCRNGAFGAPRM
jgi:hypothetical protein